MKQLILPMIFVLLNMLSGCKHGYSEESKCKIQIASNKQTDYAIVIGTNATEAERFAADQLRLYLSKITGAEFKIVAESTKPVAKNYIYVGPTSYTKKKGIDYSGFGHEEWLIKTSNDSIVIGGGRPRGTLYGVFEFLEKFGDCVWTDEYFEYIPEQEDFHIPCDIDIQDKPKMWLRAYTNGHKPAKLEQFQLFNLRNKYNYAYLGKKMGYSESHGSPGMCHTFYYYSQAFPEKKKDYFALGKDGKRLIPESLSHPGQLCLTNPEVRKLVYQQLRRYIAADRAKRAKTGAPAPRIYAISPNDTPDICYCPTCKKLTEKEGSYAGPYLDFINNIARKIEVDYPELYILYEAYQTVLIPPKNIKPHKNVIVRLADLGAEANSGRSESLKSIKHSYNYKFKADAEAWAAISPQTGIWEYWNIFDKPFPFPYSIVENFQDDFSFFDKIKTKIFFTQIYYPESTSFFDLKRWLGLKMMQNPTANADQLTETFMGAYYGAAAKPMKDYLNYLEKRLANDPTRHSKLLAYHYKYLDLPFFVTVNKLLDQAEQLVANDEARLAHVRHERVPIDGALVYMWDNLEAAGRKLPYNRNEIIKRYKANTIEQLKRYVHQDKLAKEIKAFNSKIEALKCKPPLPEQFNKAVTITDFYWPEFRSLKHLGSEIVKDPEAAGGKALQLINNRNKPGFFDGNFEISVYNVKDKKYALRKSLPKKEIYKDGKYHWYKLGKADIKKGAYLFVHKTCHTQILIDKSINPEPEWDVYVSMKFTGPAFVPGSKGQNAVYVDRVILYK